MHTLDFKSGEVLGVIGEHFSDIRYITKAFEEKNPVIMSAKTKLFENYSAYDNLVFIACMNDISVRKARESASNFLHEFEIWQDNESKIKGFDTASYRKLIVASAFISKPEFVVLEDMLKDLDIATIGEVVSFLKKRVEEEKVAVVISGSQPEFLSFCDSYIFVKDEKIKAQGTLNELITKLKLKPVVKIETIDNKLFGIEEFETQGKCFLKEVSSYADMPKLFKTLIENDNKLLSANLYMPTISEVYKKVMEENT